MAKKSKRQTQGAAQTDTTCEHCDTEIKAGDSHECEFFGTALAEVVRDLRKRVEALEGK